MTTNTDRWLQHVLKIHFDPDTGTPYWLDQQKHLDFNPLQDIRSVDDLALFGAMDESQMALRPIGEFVPRQFRTEKERWIIGETGGSTGQPKTTIYSEDEFHKAFIEPFILVARHRQFPTQENWLWIGPSGPHLIGKAARVCAKVMQSPDPFAVDFDPRWIKKLEPNSIGFKRYFDHVIEQALRILDTQKIGVLFTTPLVLEKLQGHMPARQRTMIKGVHFGGVALEQTLFAQLEKSFPKSIFISGYGNTLFGMCPEFHGRSDHALDYYPIGNRLVLQTVMPKNDFTTRGSLRNSMKSVAKGRLVFSRLDESCLLINQFERDEGELIKPDESAQRLGIVHCGIRNPKPLQNLERKQHVAVGLY